MLSQSSVVHTTKFPTTRRNQARLHGSQGRSTVSKNDVLAFKDSVKLGFTTPLIKLFFGQGLELPIEGLK